MNLFKSITITEPGYYEVTFTKHGCFLTKVNHNILNNTSNWFKLKANQYVEGTSFQDCVIKESKPLLDTSNIIFNGKFVETQQPGYVTWVNHSSLPQQSSHTCTNFKTYQGLLEIYEYCSVCEKKK